MTQHRVSLGRTGLDVPRLGLGLAALGRPAYMTIGHDEDIGADKSVEGLRSRAWEVLDEAYQCGVRYFDCARSYGRGEDFLGSWLSHRKITDAVVASKWGYRYTGQWLLDPKVHEEKQHTLQRYREQWPESQAALGVSLKVYQIHSVTLETGVLERRDVLAELATQKQNGVWVGLTVTGTQQAAVIERALGVEVDGVPLFDVCQVTFNILEPSASAALVLAKDAGCGVVIKEPLANGLLTARGLQHDEQLAPLASFAAARGSSVDALALAFVLAQPFVDVVLSGAATVGHLHSNLKAEELQLGAPDFSALGQFASPSEDYWKKRAALPWR